MTGVDVRIVAAAGRTITTPLASPAQANRLCSSEPQPPADATENAYSAGFVMTYGRFTFLDLGDLTKRVELQLVCPANLLGTTDVFLVTHHGSNNSNPRALVWAVHPRVAIINNGMSKGGSPDTWQIVHDSPGLEDIWQLHYALAGGKQHNASDQFLANVSENSDGHYIEVSAEPDGSFSVFNSRTDQRKSYK
jgi:hypothetical protein